MKKVLLLVLLSFQYSVYAQSWELCLGGGISTNTSPGGNMEYKADQSLLNYAATLKLIYTNKANWQFGFDGHLLELSSKSSKKYGGYYNDELHILSVGGDDKKLVYAKYAPAFCFSVNKKFVFENKSDVYAGIAVGYGFARNNSEHFNANEGYKGPDGGRGFVYGVQLGYTKDFSEKLGFNFEAALRYYDFKFTAEAPQRPMFERLHYNVIAFPITIGLRYYISRVDQSSYGTYNIHRNRYY
jgi:hypothetical protein